MRVSRLRACSFSVPAKSCKSCETSDCRGYEALPAALDPTTPNPKSASRDLDTSNKAAKAELVELDMAEAITELTKQETSLQAAQATFGRLANLSLFDYL